MHIALQQHVGMQSHVDLGQRGRHVLFGVEVDATECLLQPPRAGVGQVHVATVVVGGEITVGIPVGDQLTNEPDDLEFGGLAMRSARQYQRHQCLVDEDRVGLVNDCDVGVGRHQISDVGDKLVAQDIEADLVDGGVGDIALVCGPTFLAGRIGGDPADCQTHRLDQRSHPFGVAAGQIVIDGHHVDAAPAECVPRRGDRTGECFSLTGAHLDDVPGHHPQRAEQLDVEGAQAGGPLGRHPSDGQELRGVGRGGEVREVQQPGRLGQLLTVETGSLVGELLRRRHLRHRMRRDLFVGRAEQSPESPAQPALAGGNDLGSLRHGLNGTGGRPDR